MATKAKPAKKIVKKKAKPTSSLRGKKTTVKKVLARKAIAAKSSKGKKVIAKKAIVKQAVSAKSAVKFKAIKLKLVRPVPSDIDIAQASRFTTSSPGPSGARMDRA